jgi:hypothetical protein
MSIIQAAVLVVTDQLNIIMMQDFKASKDSDIVQVAMTQMLNKLEAVLLMVLHSVDQDMISAVTDKISVDIAQLVLQLMLDLSEDTILVDMDKISVHKLDMISVDTDKISEDIAQLVPQPMLVLSEDMILVVMDKILELKLDTISVDMDRILVLKQDMISGVLQLTHKPVMISEVQDMVDMTQMLNKSEEVMHHSVLQELEIVDGKCRQDME